MTRTAGSGDGPGDGLAGRPVPRPGPTSQLCSLSGVLLADPDGVYDPGFYNDRLLLGLKGTMSEAELYLIRQRMLSGKLAKAGRGELAIPLPIGYVRRPSGKSSWTPMSRPGMWSA